MIVNLRVSSEPPVDIEIGFLFNLRFWLREVIPLLVKPISRIVGKHSVEHIFSEYIDCWHANVLANIEKLFVPERHEAFAFQISSAKVNNNIVQLRVEQAFVSGFKGIGDESIGILCSHFHVALEWHEQPFIEVFESVAPLSDHGQTHVDNWCLVAGHICELEFQKTHIQSNWVMRQISVLKVEQ